MPARHAVFFAPAPGSALEGFGRSWLGRDAAIGRPVPQPEVAGIVPARLGAITASPRHYGFHATLKAPFVLAEGRTPGQLDAAVRALATASPPFEVWLEVTSLAGFLAFTLARPSPEMDALATACVTELDGFRRPPGSAELARRRQSGLTPCQEANLQRFGYPYVLDDFRFHMTLTERLEPPERDHVLAILRELTAELTAKPLRIDAIAIFSQPSLDQPLVIRARHAFGGRGA